MTGGGGQHHRNIQFKSFTNEPSNFESVIFSKKRLIPKYNVRYPKVQACLPIAQARKLLPQPVAPVISRFSALCIKEQSATIISFSFDRFRLILQYTCSSTQSIKKNLSTQYRSPKYCLSQQDQHQSEIPLQQHQYQHADSLS